MYRKDINIIHPTTEDQQYWNVDFVSADINGFAMVFVIARRDIARNEELLAYYGEDYKLALHQQTEYERMRTNIQNLVQQPHIIQTRIFTFI